MYQIVGYTAVNTLGTANLLQSIVDREIKLQRLVVASSMSIYGEGQYARPDGQYVTRALRPRSQLQSREWEVRDADGTVLSPVPTAETKQLHPTSIYALTKADQEQMTLQIGAAYDIPTVALRFFNIYGPRQALSNPYTGVAAIFSSRLLNGERPLIFEDGEQRRDFVSVHDVVRSLLLAAESDRAVGKAINIGSGRAVTIRQVAATLARVLGVDIEPEINGKYRVGDIRHCYADITIACETLGYAPRVSFEEGMEGLVEWLRQQRQPKSSLRQHAEELALRGLTL
jgi:dTDP-L-rhamnose 4-epimerase